MLTKIKTKSLFVMQRIKSIRQYYWFGAAGGIAVAAFFVAYWPQEVTFSYQGQTCIGQLHIAPGGVRAESEVFGPRSDAIQKIGGASVFANKVCFSPLSAPRSGNYTVALTLPGVPLLKKLVTIHVPTHPVASAAQLKAAVPLSKKLTIGLSSTDKIFSYRLRVADKSVLCDYQPYGVGCDIKKLGLEQGSAYALQLDRYFNDTRIATVLKSQMTTLKATALTSSSITEGETVFAKPKSMVVQFDKPIKTFEATLVQSDGDKKIPLEHAIKGSQVTISWSGELPRQQPFKLNLSNVQASDDSMLPESTVISFKTSGGPAVTNINIGTSKVAEGAIATLTFDQPLKDGQDIGKIITASGGARVTGYQGQKVTVSFASVARCTDVTLKISNDLESNYEIKGGTAWQYTTRTACHAITSIGTSTKGRSILAYVFGSGAKKIVYTGAIHGDEVSTRSLMMRWIDALEANPRSIPSDKTVIVIPAINPDGYASGARLNSRSVDLNRNFGTNDWQQDITTVSNKPFPGGGGDAPFSEVESAAIANYIARIHPTLVLSYHSIGGLVAANQTGISTQFANRYAALSGYRNSTGSPDAFDYAVSGTADDYYGQILGVSSVLVELGSHTDPQFSRNQQAMWAMLRES